MLSNDAVLSLCTHENPAIIYLGIGCSQAHRSISQELQPQQEYPLFLEQISGSQICILIDPLLESPPVAFPKDIPEDPSGITRVGRTSFIMQRRYFDWTTGSPDDSFIERLCMFCMHTPTRLIVQDYTGQYIHNYYPLERFGPVLLKQVLYDFTYNDGGCFIDFSKVKLLIRPDGSFVQPRYETITAIRDYVSHEQMTTLLKERQLSVTNYIRRLYRIQRGQEEYRDWCTADVVSRRMASLCVVFGLPHNTDTETLERMMLAYLWDLTAAVHDYISEEDALLIIRRPTAEYEDALKLLVSVLV